LATSPNVASLLEEETAASSLPPKGGVPPEAGRGELLGPPKGGVPPEAGRGELLGPPGEETRRRPKAMADSDLTA
jgi:hypothetical protein